MSFDPDAYLKGGTATVTSPEKPAGFDPDSYLKADVPHGTLPDVNPLAGADASHWHNLYAGMDGLDDRLNPEQKNAFAALDRDSQDPKEGRASVINQAYLQGKMPQLSGQFIANNLQAVTDSYAKEAFGIEGKGMTQTTLYGKISDQFKQEQEVATKTEWAMGTPGHRIEMLLHNFLPAFNKNAGQVWNDVNKPFVALPSAPQMPDLPGMGMSNPALLAGAWNVAKPVLEGVESPLGVATLGVGAELKAGVEGGSVVARRALAAMSGVFTGLFLKATVQGAPETMRVLNDPNSTTQQKIEAAGGSVRDAALAVIGTMGTAFELKPELAKLVEKKTPRVASDALRVEALTEKNPETAKVISDAAEQLKSISPDAIKQLDAVPLEEGQSVKMVEGQPVVTDAQGGELVHETSLKNATAELERDYYGLEEASPPEKRAMADSWNRAAEAMAKDPKAGEVLAERLKADPNLGLSDDQSALLLRHKVDIEKSLDAAAETANSAETPEADKTAASARVTELSQQLQEFMDAVHRRGSEWGREGRWRQAMAKEDYSFAAQDRLLRAAKGGAELTAEERTGLLEKIDAMKKKQAQLERHIETLSTERPGTTNSGKNVISEYIDRQADAARVRLRKRITGEITSSSLALGSEVLVDYAIIGAQHIKNGAVKFADWSAEMVKEFGDSIAPHLKDIYDQAKARQAQTADQIKTELGELKDKMAEAPENAKADKRPGLTDEQRLNQFKARTQARILELQDKLDKGDFAPAARRSAVALDERGLKLKAELERLKQDFAIGRELAKEEAKPALQKGLTKAADLARASALSGYHTLAKLATYSLAKFAEVPATEAMGALLRRLPGMEEISARANLEAGREASGLAKFYTKAATRGARDAWETLLTGKSDLKAEVGNARETSRPVHWYDYFGISHAAEKAPLFRGAFELALEKNTAHAIANGMDVTDGSVQAALRKEAGDYAQRAILQENNMFSDWLNSLTSRMEAVNPKTKQVDVNKAVLSAFIKTFLTKGIVKTPANYIMQTLERTPLGLARGTAGAVIAHARGIETLSPAEANTITRLQKAGLVGSAMFVWGAIDATKKEEDRIFGGYYQPGDKRDAKDVSFGKLRVDGLEIPHLFTHNPLTESAQMGSTMMRVTLSKLHKHDKESKGALAGAVASVLALASEAPVVSPITRTAQSVEQGRADRVMWDLISGLVPQLVQNVAQDTDPAKWRTPRDLPEAIKATIPGLREEVPASKKH